MQAVRLAYRQLLLRALIGVRQVGSPNVSVSDRAQEKLRRCISELGPEGYSVVIVYASASGKEDWRWEIAFHRSSDLDPEFCFEIGGVPFYFDGPFYKDERSVQGKEIGYINGVFTFD